MPLPISRVRAMPWVMVIQLAMTLRCHWTYLTPGEPCDERAEVRLLVRKLEPIAIARSVVPIGRKAVSRRR
jgi:hypothetical protein